jgi:hypothetical protein
MMQMIKSGNIVNRPKHCLRQHSPTIVKPKLSPIPNNYKRNNNMSHPIVRENPSFSFLKQGITVSRVKKGMRGILSYQ